MKAFGVGSWLQAVRYASSPVYIVALREILPEVAAAAFLPPQRRVRDE
jgi:hypothetical protein